MNCGDQVKSSLDLNAGKQGLHCSSSPKSSVWYWGGSLLTQPVWTIDGDSQGKFCSTPPPTAPLPAVTALCDQLRGDERIRLMGEHRRAVGWTSTQEWWARASLAAHRGCLRVGSPLFWKRSLSDNFHRVFTPPLPFPGKEADLSSSSTTSNIPGPEVHVSAALFLSSEQKQFFPNTASGASAEIGRLLCKVF